MLIVGLGNPGKEYEHTRHNVGFWCADKLATHFSTKFSENRKYHAEMASFKLNGLSHQLMKPLTYMNASGEAVAAFVEENNISAADILVIEDDINLPIGRIRMRAEGSAGGHNGLKSIISVVGEGFWRIRVGVGQPKSTDSHESEHEKLISHVLGEISSAEAQIFKTVTNTIPEIVDSWLKGEGNQAMNLFNGKNFCL